MKERVYIPALDGLRFFAFTFVFLYHALRNQSTSNILISPLFTAIHENGWIGLDLFFILSGFLITTLLVKERIAYGQFSLKKFWIRRILRIWPLYYLAVCVGFILIPDLNPKDYPVADYGKIFSRDFPLYLTFMGNWPISYETFSPYRYVAHLWSISIEEQFYLVWPLILYFIPSTKKLFFIILLTIIGALSYRYFLTIDNVKSPTVYTSSFARVDIFAIGAALALIYCYYPKVILTLKKFITFPIQIAVLILLFVFLFKEAQFNPLYLKYSVWGYNILQLFLVFFLLSSLLDRKLFTNFLSLPPLVWLGKISYGLYVWHLFGIFSAQALIKDYDLGLTGPFVAFLITLTTAVLSYYLFEKRFLGYKKKFSRIRSRPI